MTLAYAAFYFVPQPQTPTIPLDEAWNLTLNLKELPLCHKEVCTANLNLNLFFISLKIITFLKTY